MRTLIKAGRFSFVALVIGLFLCGGQKASAQTVGPHDVLITEFRLEGPGFDGTGDDGFADEYMEFYCNRDTACDVSGFNIIAYDPSFGDFNITFPAGTVLPARSYLLIGDDFGYSLNSYATLDFTASFGGEADFFVDNEGFQLTNADGSVVIDSVGFTGGGNPTGAGDPSTINYIEGTGLQRATAARPDDQYAYVRKIGTATAGRPQDTDNNAGDFVLVSVTGAAHPGITAPPVLGAPGPQNTLAPIERNATIPGALVEPNASSAASPNRVRAGSGNSGTISIRRSFTNNTTEDITFLIFRAIDITTLNSPGYVPGGAQADLRLISSGNAETFTNSQGRTVVIQGTALEFDAGSGIEPEQPNGGGLNSSMSVALGPDGIIAPGETVDVQFLLNVVQAGRFRFFVNVEASTTPPVPLDAPQSLGVPHVGAARPMSSSVPARKLSPRRRFSRKASPVKARSRR